jgi:arylsulfatase A-like enzyme
MTARRRPNILLILTDDQRADTIAALGNGDLRTPHLDGLVRRGTVFRNACIMGGTQPAVCCPSRNMLLTGRSLFRIGGRTGEVIPPGHACLPEMLRGECYRTHHIGKWHQDRASFHRSFSAADRIFGFTPGWYVQTGGHWNVAVHDFDPEGTYPEEGGYLLDADKQTKHPVIPGRGGVHSSEMFSDAAVEFLDRQGGAGDQPPFFLYLAYVAPHDPRQSPEEYERRYEPSALPLPPNFLERHPFDNGEFSVRDEMLEAWPRRPHAIRRHLADYYACIEHLDAQIGRVLEALDRNDLRDDTIIVFTSDNGLGIGSHGLLGKQNLYEHSVGVPLVLAGPGIPSGAVDDRFCYLQDVFPTLCDLAGLPVPASVEGRSLVAPAHDAGAGERDALYHAYCGVQRAVRVGDDKLIEYVTPVGRQTQLFDLRHDPHETMNLAALPEQAGKVAALRERLFAMKAHYGDDRVQESQFWSGPGSVADPGGG